MYHPILTCQPPWNVYYNSVFYNVVCLSVIPSLWEQPFLILQLLSRNLVIGWSWSAPQDQMLAEPMAWTIIITFLLENHSWFRAGHMTQAWLIAPPWESYYFFVSLSVPELHKSSQLMVPKKKKKKNKKQKEWASNFPTTYIGTSSWLGMKPTWRKQSLVMERKRKSHYLSKWTPLK